jgi:FAS-associated factor 2
MEAEQSSADEWWGFKLIIAYPRQEISWTPSGKLSEIPGLQGGGSVVVELVDDIKDPLTAAADDDGYESEE